MVSEHSKCTIIHILNAGGRLLLHVHVNAEPVLWVFDSDSIFNICQRKN